MFSSSLVYRIKGAAGSGDNTVPFSEFFTLGGISDFPGLYERERLGRQIATLSNELRYRIHWNLPLSVYMGAGYHIGSTWESTEDPIEGNDFLTSWDVSLSTQTIFGPIQLVFSRLTGVRSMIYFSLGYEF
jgi:outer membrane protein assembly factor BamA